MINFDIERDLHKRNILMIGVDEAGRGSWAGPLVSTACWFDFTKYKSLHSEINDSKKLKSSKRREIILSLDNFVKYSSSIASVEEIDKYGLSYANAIAMKRSMFSLIQELKNTQTHKYKNFCIYLDGKFKPNFENLDKIKNFDINSLPLLDKNQRIGSCVFKPANFFAIGLNYKAHAAETNSNTPKEPIVFNKSPNCIVGPNDDIVIPKFSKSLDHEVEIAIV